jgi:hypothetical protein
MSKFKTGVAIAALILSAGAAVAEGTHVPEATNQSSSFYGSLGGNEPLFLGILIIGAVALSSLDSASGTNAAPSGS